MKLVATNNTNTDYLALAAPVTEANTAPVIVSSENPSEMNNHTGDWVSISSLRTGPNMVTNSFGLGNYTEVYDGALVDL